MKIDKKYLKFIGIGLLTIAVIIGVIVLIVSLVGGILSYDKIEMRMKNAAISYFKDYADKLPVEGTEVKVTTFDLEEGKYIKPINKMVKKGVICNGEVIVKNINNSYVYIPYLDCGTDYSTTSVVDKIKDSKTIVTSGAGIYNINNEYVYKGEVVKNYIKYDEKLWRIVKVDKNNDVVLIATDFKEKTVWDDRYNVDKGYNSGINIYGVSRIKEALDVISKNNTLLTTEAFGKLNKYSLCIGKRSYQNGTNDGSLECASTLDGQYIGLLPIYDYINASMDAGCKKPSDSQCQNYNYLNYYSSSWWSLTANLDNTYQTFKIEGDGGVTNSNSLSYSAIRPVIHLSNLAMIASGDGTVDNPYIVK